MSIKVPIPAVGCYSIEPVSFRKTVHGDFVLPDLSRRAICSNIGRIVAAEEGDPLIGRLVVFERSRCDLIVSGGRRFAMAKAENVLAAVTE